MRPGQQQQNKQRMRGRGRKGPNPLSRSYESNGPDVKIRGTAQHVAEKYTTLARDASAAGDRVMAENYLQHAEHYGRIVAAAQGTFQLQRDDRDGEFGDDEGDDDGLDEGGYVNVQSNGSHSNGGNGNGGNGSGMPQPDVAQPQSQQPQMRDNRDNRDRGNRDFNREARDGNRDQNQNRDQSPNRDGNRDQSRDLNREPNRDGRDGNREARDGNREFNRDGNREARDANRDPRDNRGNRGRDGNRDFNRDGRDNRNQPQMQPTGLGPQPFVNVPVAAAPAASPVVASPSPSTSHGAGMAETRRDERAFEPEAVRPDETRVEAAGPDDVRVQNEPRRRGRPRRVRIEDGDVRNASPAPAEEGGRPEPGARAETPTTDTAPSAPAEQPMPARASGDAPSADAETPVKRRPGRPRKKKPEDDAGPEGGDHLPAFLMASNG